MKIADGVVAVDMVNDLRDRVRCWRGDNYPGATPITRDLFRHWFDDDRKAGVTRPFFCRQEAVETVVFLTESPADRKAGVTRRGRTPGEFGGSRSGPSGTHPLGSTRGAGPL